MLCVGIYMKTGVCLWALFHVVGLLRIRQDKTLLRAKCLIPYPAAYYFAIVNNTILRFAWILKLFIVIVLCVVFYGIDKAWESEQDAVGVWMCWGGPTEHLERVSNGEWAGE